MADPVAARREEKIQAMYSQIRYPGLDLAANERYVRHRRFVYQKLGLEVDHFFQGKRVLDAGCGTGEETLFLASLGPAQVVGIDISEGSLEVARASAARIGLQNVEFIRASVLDESLFPEEDFDYVSSLGCIHHTSDMPRAFANLCRLVRPGGYLCTFIYNSFGHFFYNLECSLLDWLAGDEIEKRVRLARRLFDWRRHKTFCREGIRAAYDSRLYDKYGVLYRESLSLKEVLGWYAAAGFVHVGSFPLCLKDMVGAFKAREGERGGEGLKGWLAQVLDAVLEEKPRQWSWSRRFAMQGLLLLMGFYDYGNAFRILGRKRAG